MLSAADLLQPSRVDLDALDADDFGVGPAGDLRRDVDFSVDVNFLHVIGCFADDGGTEQLDGLGDADDTDVVNGREHGHFVVRLGHGSVFAHFLDLLSERSRCVDDQHFSKAHFRLRRSKTDEVFLFFLLGWIRSEAQISTEDSQVWAAFLYDCARARKRKTRTHARSTEGSFGPWTESKVWGQSLELGSLNPITSAGFVRIRSIVSALKSPSGGCI